MEYKLLRKYKNKNKGRMKRPNIEMMATEKH
jgi:hypothetical protein